MRRDFEVSRNDRSFLCVRYTTNLFLTKVGEEVQERVMPIGKGRIGMLLRQIVISRVSCGWALFNVLSKVTRCTPFESPAILALNLFDQ